MRSDGEVTYYSIEQLIENLETKDKYYYECGDLSMLHGVLSQDEKNEFTACGECWQKYGYHGTLNYDTAIKIMDKLRAEILYDETKNSEITARHFSGQYKPRVKTLDFRVVGHKMSQETTYYERVSDIKSKLQNKNDIVNWLNTKINELTSLIANINTQVNAILDDPTNHECTADLLTERDDFESQLNIYDSMLYRIAK